MRQARTADSLLVFSLALLSIAFSLTSGSRAGESKTPKVYGEPTPDKALVYFIRPRQFQGGLSTVYLYAGQRFLGVLDKDSYSFAFVEPGAHLFWTSRAGVTRELELIPGQTYYLDVWNSISVLREETGNSLVQQVKHYVVPTEFEIQAAAVEARDDYGVAKHHEARKPKADIAPVAPVPHVPSDLTGMLRVPAYSPVEVELMENVSSELSTTGEPVWFRLVGDAAVEGGIYLRSGGRVEGIIRLAARALIAGFEGSLEIVIPSVTAADGTAIPLVGQIASKGKNQQDAALRGAMVVSSLLGILTTGEEAYHLVGERFRVWTRHEAWVDPIRTTEEKAPPSQRLEIDLSLNAQSLRTVTFSPRFGITPSNAEILFETEIRPQEVEAYFVEGWALAEPVQAARITHTRKGWIAAFTGWDLTRYLRAAEGARSVPVNLRGRLADGRRFSTGVLVTIKLTE